MRPRGNRRLAALLTAGAAALATGAAVGAGAGDGPGRAPAGSGPSAPPRASAHRARSAVDGWSIPRLAGAVVVMRFHGAPEPAYVRQALRRGQAAGVILFRDDLPSAAATRAMDRRLQRAAPGPAAIVCTDQEGGGIRNLPWVGPVAGQPALRTAGAVRAATRAAGRGLRADGVNVDLAPVADLAGPGTLMAGRAYAGGPAVVAPLVSAAVRGYRAAGIAPTAKHFPGLGPATANTDRQPVTITTPAAELGRTALPSFKAAIAAGVPLVMVSNATYTGLDPAHVAGQSRAIVTGLLKRRLGFRGVAVTDSIEARAISSRWPPGHAAVRSLRAGVDLVLTTGPGSHLRVLRAIRAAAHRSARFRARLRDAAARVLALRRTLPG